jgi:hypothetical protein
MSQEFHILSEPVSSSPCPSEANAKPVLGEPSASEERLRITMTRPPANDWTLARTAQLGGLAMTVHTEGDTG